jgi:hypothetical protein
MEMIVLDWTRMGQSYCLAGVVAERGGFRVVRPLLARYRDAPVRNIGWSPFLLDGHARWEVFELVRPEPADAEPPHVEDVWVQTLKPRHRTIPPGQRREVLAATMAVPGAPVFGTSLTLTLASAYLDPGTGRRSLATLAVPVNGLRFTASQREGVAEVEVRLALHIPPLGDRPLPFKDHHLLARAEQASPAPEGQAKALDLAVRQMGERVAVRLGLTRPFQPTNCRGPGKCWLMVDGLFSLANPES